MNIALKPLKKMTKNDLTPFLPSFSASASFSASFSALTPFLPLFGNFPSENSRGNQID